MNDFYSLYSLSYTFLSQILPIYLHSFAYGTWRKKRNHTQMHFTKKRTGKSLISLLKIEKLRTYCTPFHYENLYTTQCPHIDWV